MVNYRPIDVKKLRIKYNESSNRYYYELKGAYLIPYFTSMFILVMPMIYLEFIVGQFTSDGMIYQFLLSKFKI